MAEGDNSLLGLPVFPNGQPIWQVLSHDASNIPSLPVHRHWLEAVAALG